MDRIESIKIDEIEMDVAIIGEGKEPFVMIPGLSVTPVTPLHQAVKGQYKDILNTHTIYLVDRRKNMPDKYTLKEMADDTVKVLKHMGIEKPIIFGTSQGGMVTMTIASHYSDYPESIILASTDTKVKENHAINEWIELAENGSKKELGKSFCKLVYSANMYEKFKDVFDTVGEQYTDEEIKRFTILAKAIKDIDFTDDLENIICKAMVFGCHGDQVLNPKAAEMIAAKLGGECYMYGPEYGHGVYDEAADFVQKMRTWMDRNYCDRKKVK